MNKHTLMQYKQGLLSLGNTAGELHLSLSELLDLLADLGIPSPVQYDDYLEGLRNMEKLQK